MRQAAVTVGDVVDIEIDGAGNMVFGIFRFAVPPGVRQMPRAVDDAYVGGVEPGRQPGGVDQGFRGHALIPLGLHEGDDDTAVLTSLVFDLGDLDGADFTGRRHMGAATGL